MMEVNIHICLQDEKCTQTMKPVLKTLNLVYMTHFLMMKFTTCLIIDYYSMPKMFCNSSINTNFHDTCEESKSHPSISIIVLV